LLGYGCHPFVIFDGKKLGMKSITYEKRLQGHQQSPDFDSSYNQLIQDLFIVNAY
jgi:5'-3' exonuclease